MNNIPKNTDPYGAGANSYDPIKSSITNSGRKIKTVETKGQFTSENKKLAKNRKLSSRLINSARPIKNTRSQAINISSGDYNGDSTTHRDEQIAEGHIETKEKISTEVDGDLHTTSLSETEKNRYDKTEEIYIESDDYYEDMPEILAEPVANNSTSTSAIYLSPPNNSPAPLSKTTSTQLPDTSTDSLQLNTPEEIPAEPVANNSTGTSAIYLSPPNNSPAPLPKTTSTQLPDTSTDSLQLNTPEEIPAEPVANNSTGTSAIYLSPPNNSPAPLSKTTSTQLPDTSTDSLQLNTPEEIPAEPVANNSTSTSAIYLSPSNNSPAPLPKTTSTQLPDTSTDSSQLNTSEEIPATEIDNFYENVSEMLARPVANNSTSTSTIYSSPSNNSPASLPQTTSTQLPGTSTDSLQLDTTEETSATPPIENTPATEQNNTKLDKIKNVFSKIEKWIEDNPFKAKLIALGVITAIGFAFGGPIGVSIGILAFIGITTIILLQPVLKDGAPNPSDHPELNSPTPRTPRTSPTPQTLPTPPTNTVTNPEDTATTPPLSSTTPPDTATPPPVTATTPPATASTTSATEPTTLFAKTSENTRPVMMAATIHPATSATEPETLFATTSENTRPVMMATTIHPATSATEPATLFATTSENTRPVMMAATIHPATSATNPATLIKDITDSIKDEFPESAALLETTLENVSPRIMTDFTNAEDINVDELQQAIYHLNPDINKLNAMIDHIDHIDKNEYADVVAFLQKGERLASLDYSKMDDVSSLLRNSLLEYRDQLLINYDINIVNIDDVNLRLPASYKAQFNALNTELTDISEYELKQVVATCNQNAGFILASNPQISASDFKDKLLENLHAEVKRNIIDPDTYNIIATNFNKNRYFNKNKYFNK